jgi:hypothetical protein
MSHDSIFFYTKEEKSKEAHPRPNSDIEVLEFGQVRCGVLSY